MTPADQVSNQGELWPYEEARKLAERVGGYRADRPAIIESGFGPSGLPHLGTMGEVLRPSYVRHACQLLDPTRPCRLIVFIDDMDGLRKVPESVPNREQMAAYIGQPVSRIPDPFGCCQSFSAHMVDMLIDFLKPVAVDYELMRSSETYASGRFDAGAWIDPGPPSGDHQIVAPTLQEGKPQPVVAFPAHLPRLRAGKFDSGHRLPSGAAQRRVFLRAQLRRRHRMRIQGRAERAGRQGQGAVEGGLGAALVRLAGGL